MPDSVALTEIKPATSQLSYTELLCYQRISTHINSEHREQNNFAFTFCLFVLCVLFLYFQAEYVFSNLLWVVILPLHELGVCELLNPVFRVSV